MVLGSANPHREEVRQLVERRPHTTFHVQVDTVAKLMASADLALCAGGSSTWERLSLGLPSLVVTIADNQVPFTRDLNNDRLLRWLGSSQDVDVVMIKSALKVALMDSERNRQESEAGMLMVDGNGAVRVTGLITQGPSSTELLVRRATQSDCALFWHWVNDQEVRASAFSSDPIPWETHQLWFRRRLEDPGSTLYVIEAPIGPIGQVRFEKVDGEYSISYSLGRQFRGVGLGKAMLQKAIDVFHSSQSGILTAEVKIENLASSKVFERLGFSELPPPPTRTEGFFNYNSVRQKRMDESMAEWVICNICGCWTQGVVGECSSRGSRRRSLFYSELQQACPTGCSVEKYSQPCHPRQRFTEGKGVVSMDMVDCRRSQ